VPYVPSPNFSSRKGHGIEGIVIHYTAGGSASGTVRWFANPASRVSAHFVLSRSGRVTQMVALEHAAWHAGASEMMVRGEMQSDVNRFTIGIELANRGWLQRDRDGAFWYELAGNLYRYRGDLKPVEARLVYDNGISVDGWWEPYSEAQIEGLDWLLKALRDVGYRQAVSHLWGHEEIAVPFGTRKRDPGPLFPWERFGRQSGRRTEALLLGSEGRPLARVVECFFDR
jgi:N-acetylmuramoyl-L-alanine amidase